MEEAQKALGLIRLSPGKYYNWMRINKQKQSNSKALAVANFLLIFHLEPRHISINVYFNP